MLDFLRGSKGVGMPSCQFNVAGNIHAKDLEALNPFHFSISDADWVVCSTMLSELAP